MASFNDQYLKDQQMQAFLKAVALQGQDQTLPGAVKAYDVPTEQQGTFGEKYLTNAVLPTTETPVSAPMPKAVSKEVTNAPLTSQNNVDWSRVSSTASGAGIEPTRPSAGNYEKVYSIGQTIPGQKIDWNKPEDVGKVVNMAAGTGIDTTPFAKQRDTLLARKDKLDAAAQKNSASGMVENPNPSLTGEAAMQNYSPRVQNLARQLADYKIPFPSSFALKDPKSEWNAAIQAAKDLDPTFDATQYGVRRKVRESFTSGKDAQNITSINTAIGHLDTLDKAAGALSNTGNRPWNYVANTTLQTMTDDPRFNRFQTAANAVESELASVFKGTGATDQEIKAWRENFSQNMGPQTYKNVISQAIELLGSRMGALRSKYEQGIGKPLQFNILNDKSRQILQNIGVDPATLDASQPKAETAASIPGYTDADINHTAKKYGLTREQVLQRLQGGK